MTKRNEVLAWLFPNDDVDSIEGEFVETSPSLFDSENPYEEYLQPYEGDVLGEVFERNLKYLNLNPGTLRKLQKSGDPSVDMDALRVALSILGMPWDENEIGGIEIGEPYRGEQVKAQYPRQLNELIGEDKAPPYFETLGHLSTVIEVRDGNTGKILGEDDGTWVGLVVKNHHDKDDEDNDDPEFSVDYEALAAGAFHEDKGSDEDGEGIETDIR